MLRPPPLKRAPRPWRTVKPHHAIYGTKRWAMTRRRVIGEEGVCRTCGRLASHVDHIIPLDRGGALWSRDNLQALCTSCHSRKTRAEAMS